MGEMFDGKEDYVWVGKSGFDAYRIEDCVEFFAEVYRYVKTGNGKQIDYSLRNSKEIKKIAFYELPRDDDLTKQGVNQMICEICFLYEHCINHCVCVIPRKKVLQEQMFESVT